MVALDRVTPSLGFRVVAVRFQGGWSYHAAKEFRVKAPCHIIMVDPLVPVHKFSSGCMVECGSDDRKLPIWSWQVAWGKLY